MSINDFRLYGDADSSSSGGTTVSVSRTGDTEISANEEIPEVPTSANKKAEIKDYLLSVGYTDEDLDGMTKAELLDMI